jgi:hypothetical protein
VLDVQRAFHRFTHWNVSNTLGCPQSISYADNQPVFISTIEHQAAAHLVGIAVGTAYVFQASPSRFVCNAPPIFQPFLSIRMSIAEFADPGSGNDMHFNLG